MNGASSLAEAAITAGRGPFSAASARMHTPFSEKACESSGDSELVTFTLCDLLHTVSATMKPIRSGLCQVEDAAMAAPAMSVNSAKKSIVHQAEGEAGWELLWSWPAV